MTDPFAFETVTAKFALPLLHTGQAGKEAFVNEAFSRTDALLHCAIEGERDEPAEETADGDVWLVGENPTGEWTGHPASLACRQNSGWLFLEPRDGLRAFDKASSREGLFFGIWRKASQFVEPLGGTTVDVQARAAITELMVALQAVGILPSA